MANFGTNSISEEWRYPVADLIVSPERAAWIMQRYPETDTGRPGVLVTDGHRHVRNADVGPIDPEIELDVN